MKTREELLDRSKHSIRTVTVSEWGDVRIRTLSLLDLTGMEAEPDPIKKALKAVIGGVVDESGKAMFTVADEAALMDMPVTIILELSKIVTGDLDALSKKTIDGTAKN